MQVNKSRGYVEIFHFTQGCNWLDVVEVYFYADDDNPGMLDKVYIRFCHASVL